MSLQDDVTKLTAAMAKVDQATTQIGAGVQTTTDVINSMATAIADLKQKLTDAGVDAALVAQLDGISDSASTSADHLQQVADALTAIAHDPTNPVPSIPTGPAPA